jgi:hypothetical protein
LLCAIAFFIDFPIHDLRTVLQGGHFHIDEDNVVHLTAPPEIDVPATLSFLRQIVPDFDDFQTAASGSFIAYFHRFTIDYRNFDVPDLEKPSDCVNSSITGEGAGAAVPLPADDASHDQRIPERPVIGCGDRR